MPALTLTKPSSPLSKTAPMAAPHSPSPTAPLPASSCPCPLATPPSASNGSVPAPTSLAESTPQSIYDYVCSTVSKSVSTARSFVPPTLLASVDSTYQSGMNRARCVLSDPKAHVPSSVLSTASSALAKCEDLAASTYRVAEPYTSSVVERARPTVEATVDYVSPYIRPYTDPVIGKVYPVVAPVVDPVVSEAKKSFSRVQAKAMNSHCINGSTNGHVVPADSPLSNGKH